MIPEYFLYVSAALLFASGISYVVATLRGEAQPNRITWVFWTLAPFVAAAAAYTEGAGLAVIPVAMNGIITLMVLLASFVNKKAYWKSTMFDYVCGVAAFLALSLWYLTSNAMLAIIFSIVTDVCASTPTLFKAYNYPESEDGLAYILAAIAMLIAIFATQQFTFDAVAFSVSAFLINTIIGIGIYRRWIFRQKVPQ